MTIFHYYNISGTKENWLDKKNVVTSKLINILEEQE